MTMIVPNEGLLAALQILRDSMDVFPFRYRLRCYLTAKVPAAGDTLTDYDLGGFESHLPGGAFSTPVMDGDVATMTSFAGIELASSGIGTSIAGYVVYRSDLTKMIVAQSFDPIYVSDATPGKRCTFDGVIIGLRCTIPPPDYDPYIAFRSDVEVSTTSTITIDVPTHDDGDLLITVIIGNDDTINPSCDGWLLRQAVGGSTSSKISILSRVADTEPTYYEFAAGGTSTVGLMFVFRHPTGIMQWQGYASDSMGDVNLVVPDDVLGPVTSSKHSLVFGVWSTPSGDTIEPPADMEPVISTTAGIYGFVIGTARVDVSEVFPAWTATLVSPEPWAALAISIDRDP